MPRPFRWSEIHSLQTVSIVISHSVKRHGRSGLGGKDFFLSYDFWTKRVRWCSKTLVFPFIFIRFCLYFPWCSRGVRVTVSYKHALQHRRMQPRNKENIRQNCSTFPVSSFDLLTASQLLVFLECKLLVASRFGPWFKNSVSTALQVNIVKAMSFFVFN